MVLKWISKILNRTELVCFLLKTNTLLSRNYRLGIINKLFLASFPVVYWNETVKNAKSAKVARNVKRLI